MRDNKFTRQMHLFQRLQALGFTMDECQALRRIEMTLHRWAEQECGDGNDYASWAIERDETTGKPYRCVYPHQGKMHRTAIADREAGALKRLKAILDIRNSRENAAYVHKTREALPHALAYHQTDPRGCALYVVPVDVIPGGVELQSCYSNGIAVAC